MIWAVIKIANVVDWRVGAWNVRVGREMFQMGSVTATWT